MEVFADVVAKNENVKVNSILKILSQFPNYCIEKDLKDYFHYVLYIDLVKNLDSNVSILERVRLASPY